MSQEKLPIGPGMGASGGWVRATDAHERGDSLKDGAFVTISKHGAVEASAEATAIALECGEARGLSQHEWVFDFYGNEETGQVAGIPVPIARATKGSVAVRWYGSKSSPRAAWHIGGVFKKNRTLRPKGEVKCNISTALGTDGLPVIVIAVKANLSTQTQSRTAPTPGAQTGKE